MSARHLTVGVTVYHPVLDWFFPGRNPNQDLDDVVRGA